MYLRKIYPKIEKTLTTFISKIDENGLIPPFRGNKMWNFYEWTEGLEGVGEWDVEGKAREDYSYDLALNSLLSYAISRMVSINTQLGFDSTDLTEIKGRLNGAIHQHFYNVERSLFETRKGSGHYSKLANALAILAGVPSQKERKLIAEKLTSDTTLKDASLSMRAFLYDALLEVDRDKYSSYVLSDIERVYAPMLKTGNNTVWETELGESDFENAGSLCHGWSAIPIYYYNTLK